MKKYNDMFYIYKFNNEKNLISINRKKPGLCEICNVTHDNENAFLIFNENNVLFGCHRNKTNSLKEVFVKEQNKIKLINNNIDDKIFNNLLLVTLELRNKLKKEIKIKNNNNNKTKIPPIKNVSKNKNRTYLSFDRYYQLGNDIITKKDSLVNLVKDFGNEKNIYKVKQKALRVVEYLEVLKKNNINKISTTLKYIFNMKKIEFSNYIKSIPLNI
jgi:hypothetical protein